MITYLYKDPQGIIAIATILSVFATLILGFIALFKDDFLDWKNKPKIKFGLSNKEPHVIQTKDLIGNWIKYFRMSIVNEGKTVAKNCQIKLISVISEKEKLSSNIIEQDKLKWSSAPLDMRYRHESIPNDISQLVPIHREGMNLSPRGGWEFCDLFQITTGNNLMFLSSGGRTTSFKDENYIVTLEISGENLKPRKAKLRLLNPISFEHIRIDWVKN